MITAWEANPKAPNPYEEPESGKQSFIILRFLLSLIIITATTLQDVRLVVAREEVAQIALGKLPRHKISLSAFLITGFELEDSQYVACNFFHFPPSLILIFSRYLIRREASQMKGVKTSKQLADLQEKRNALLTRIQNWREVQFIYTPHVVSLISQVLRPETNTPPTVSISPAPETLPENMPLFLPSSLPADIRALPELKEICQLERRLREPQADDALADIRRQRRVIQGLWHFKRLNMSGIGNKPNTRMVSLYKHFDNKTDRAAEKYRSAWRALSVLDPSGSWLMRFKELKKEDISGPGKEPDDNSSNSRFQLSWIWLVPRNSGLSNVETTIGEDEFNGTMQVEWSKARARMERWKEELLIVQEEMRRVIVYLKWKGAWWHERSSLRDHVDGTILSGVSGYAHKQAAICSRMAENCAAYWLPHLREKGIKPAWESDYEHLLRTSIGVEEEGEALDTVGGEEEDEGVALDDYEEGDEENGYEEDVDAELVLDDIDLGIDD